MSTTAISTNANGQPVTGTAGTSIGNVSQQQLGPNQFLDLLMDEMKYQNPSSPTDPTQYMSQLAQMSSVEQETNIAQSTSQSASATAVSSAVSLIGDSVTYINQSTGKDLTGTVQSVQIGSSGPTLTIGGVGGIAPSTITAVTGGSGSTGSTSSRPRPPTRARAPTRPRRRGPRELDPAERGAAAARRDRRRHRGTGEGHPGDHPGRRPVVRRGAGRPDVLGGSAEVHQARARSPRPARDRRLGSDAQPAHRWDPTGGRQGLPQLRRAWSTAPRSSPQYRTTPSSRR